MGKPKLVNHEAMRTQWLSRLAELCHRLYEPAVFGTTEPGVDARRIRCELDAIRSRFEELT